MGIKKIKSLKCVIVRGLTPVDFISRKLKTRRKIGIVDHFGPKLFLMRPVFQFKRIPRFLTFGPVRVGQPFESLLFRSWSSTNRYPGNRERNESEIRLRHN